MGAKWIRLVAGALGVYWGGLHLLVNDRVTTKGDQFGLVLRAWPAASVTVGDESRQLPAFISQNDMQKPLAVHWPGQSPKELRLDPNAEEFKLQPPPRRTEFARAADRLVYDWGWLSGLLIGVALVVAPRLAKPEPEPEDRLEPGGSIGHYRLIKVLGQGATGTVWEATLQGRRVAIKVLSPTVLAEPEFIERFEREFDVARRFNHPRLVTCQALGQVKDTYYIVMDFLSGGSLRDLLNKGRPSQAQAVHYALQIAQGLQHAHGMGVIHRDLKPDNIMVDEEGNLALADFGLARATDSKTITVTGSVLGTPAYLAPELLSGDKASASNDLYALGIILYEMLTGHLPFFHSEVIKLLSAHLTEPPPALGPEVADNLQELVGALLVKDPARRVDASAAIKQLKAAVVQA